MAESKSEAEVKNPNLRGGIGTKQWCYHCEKESARWNSRTYTYQCKECKRDWESD